LLKRGSAAEFTGRISSYGELSIELVAPPELDFVENVHELPFVENVKELGSDNVGQFVAIEGEVIGSVEIPKAGVPGDWEFTLEDNFGGTIKVWISNIIYERLSDPPSDGDILRVSGRVIEDKGEIQVQPGVPADVEVRTWKP
jgi:RecJ-like exonuclease